MDDYLYDTTCSIMKNDYNNNDNTKYDNSNSNNENDSEKTSDSDNFLAGTTCNSCLTHPIRE